jgi:PA14 domain-containing protein
MTGFFHVPADGTFTFTLTFDDGSLLFIDGNERLGRRSLYTPGPPVQSVANGDVNWR